MEKRVPQILVITAIYLLLFLLRFYQTRPPEYPVGEEVVINGVLAEEPQIRGKTQRFNLNSVPIVTWSLLEYHYGDRLEIAGKISCNQMQNAKLKMQPFDSSRQTRLAQGRNSGTVASNATEICKNRREMLFPEIALVGHTAGGWGGKIVTLRERVIEFYERSLPEPATGLLSGVVLGVKADLPSDFYENLKTTGTMHVVAASGMNVTLVAGFLMAIFWRFAGRKRALVLSSLGVIFYAALAGFSASIVRASLMGFLFFLSQYIGRQDFGVLSLGLASGAMILFSPRVIFDIGFQLSVCATVGLIIIQPRLKQFTIKIPFVSEALSTTLAAQIATLPILLVNFGRLSLISPFVNAIILWTIEPIMVFGGVGAIIGLLIEPVGKIFIYLSYGFLALFIEVVNFFGRIQLLSFSFENVPVIFGVGWYLLVCALIHFQLGHLEPLDLSRGKLRERSSE